MTYTIYHIFGKKVGCTKDFPNRVYAQGFMEGEFEILERLPESVEPEFAGNVEFAWADWFGYFRRQHYATSMKARRIAGLRGGHKTASLGKNGFQTASFEQQSEWGKKGFKVQLAKGLNPVQTGAAGRASRDGPNHASKQIRCCPRCGMKLNPGNLAKHLQARHAE